MAVADDYIVLFDYLRGTQPHCFSNLYQIKGFEGLTEGTPAVILEEAGETEKRSTDEKETSL